MRTCSASASPSRTRPQKPHSPAGALPSGFQPSATLWASPRLESCRPCARCRAPWSAAPGQFLQPFSVSLRASYLVALAVSARLLGSLPGSPLPPCPAPSGFGVALLHARGASGASPAYFSPPPELLYCVACSRATLCGERRGLSPSPPPPLRLPPSGSARLIFSLYLFRLRCCDNR